MLPPAANSKVSCVVSASIVVEPTLTLPNTFFNAGIVTALPYAEICPFLSILIGYTACVVCAELNTLACPTVILPLEVIGLSLIVNPPSVALVKPTEVTVPLGSSPDGITTQALPLLITVSPTFAVTGLLKSVITLYVNPSFAAVAVGRDVIVPPVPTLPLNNIGSGKFAIAVVT